MSSTIKLGCIIENKYKIIKLIGEGGISYVYQANDIHKNTDVALKFLKKNLISSYVEDSIRFKHEIKAISKLNHPNIIKIISAGDYENTPFVVMELIKGQNLSNYIKTNKNISIDNFVKIIKTLSDTLSYVHSENLLHRDIKPTNIMLVNDKNKIKIKLLDFGIALIMELKNITDEQHIAGTFGYMSPEATGIIKKKVDERSDLYSVGVVFYKLLTKENPFSAKKLNVLLHQQVTSNPKIPIKLNKNVPKIISNIAMKLLEKEQDYRYQSARGLSHDLDRILNKETDFILGQKDQKVVLTYQTRLIGREEELEKIKGYINNARNNQGSLCLIAGEPGAGKSRLVETVKEYLYEQGYDKGGLFLEGRCLSQTNKIPYQPFKDVINEYVKKYEGLDEKGREEEKKRIYENVGELGEILTRLNVNMKEILDNVPSLITLDPERENQRFLTVISNFFLKLSFRNQACIVYLDDLQWADEGSLRLLQEIVSGINKTNLIILGTYRVNEVNESHSLLKIMEETETKGYPIAQIEIRSFDIERMNKLVSGILGETEDKTRKLSEYVFDKSEGNPFFAITIIREIVEQKAIEWKEEYWEEDWEKIKAISIPDNIIDMILRRLEDIPLDLDNLLKIGSTIGKEFEVDILNNLLSIEKEKVVSLIDEAINGQLIERSLINKGNVIFTHDRIKEAFHEKMSKKERIHNHLIVGTELEKRYEENKEEVIFELAHHFTEGKEKEKSLKYLIPAAQKAKENYANEEAVKYYLQSIHILEKKERIGTTEWAKACEDLVDIYLTIGNPDAAIEKAKKLLSFKEIALKKAKIFRKIGYAYFKKADYLNCENALAKGLSLLGEKIPISPFQVSIAIFKALGIHLLHSFFPIPFNQRKNKTVKEKDREIIWIYVPLNWMYSLSDGTKFFYSILRMLSIAKLRIGKSKELDVSLMGYGILFFCLAMFKKSLKFLNKSIKGREELSDDWGIAQSYQMRGFCYLWSGKYQNAYDSFSYGYNLFKKIGDLWELGMTYHGIAHGYRYTSQYDKSIHFDSLHHGIAEKINDPFGMAESNSCISYCYTETGDFLKAEKLGKNAVNVSRKHNQLFALCFTTEHYGYLQLEKNNFLEAIKYLEESKDLFEKNTFLKDYTTYTYPYLADAYIEKYKINKNTKKIKLKKEELVKIKKACKKALSITMPWPNHYGASLRVSAKYYSLVNKKNKAKRYFNKAIRQTKLIGRRYELAKSHYEYGNFFDQINEKEKAERQWNKAYNIFKEIGAQEYIKHTKKLLNITDEKKTAKDDVSPQERLRLDRRMNTVLDTSRHLSSILDINELLEKIMDKTVELVGAERGILYLNINNKLKPKILRNIKQGESDLITINDIVITQVQKENKPLIFEDASSIKKSLSSDSTRSSTNISLKSILCAPIITKNELLGVLYLDNHRVTGLFKEEDLKVLELISSQAGVSIENARLYNNLKEQERLKKEMEIAKRIQTAIVPEAPLHDELYITAVMQPAEEVGGDYYDIMYDKNKNLWFAIGDVSGHGVTPGLVMMMAQSSFAATISNHDNVTPKEAIVNVNKILYENIKTRLKEDHFMTMDFIKYLGKGNFIHAGSHLDIIIYRDKTKTCELVATKGVYLGLIPDASRSLFDNTFSLNKNDLMLLYTDGVTEARNKDNRNDLWGEDKLQNMLIKYSSNEVEAIKDAIVKKVLDWCGNKPDDDITMVLIKMK